MKSKVSPVLFLVTVLCFLLPFVTVSCNGQKVATFTGVQLAAGTTVEQPQMFGRPMEKRVDAQPLATVAFICAIAGIGLSFLGVRAAIAPAISGIVGALLLVWLQSKLSSDISKQAQSMFRLEYESGFVLTLILFVAAAAWNAYVFFSSRTTPALAASPPLANAAAVGGAPTIASAACPHCDQSVSGGARFCGGCGKAVG
ncbi:MAG TPA: zinc ribbon domain-containing protein [Candidatus Angelobacter sp.]|nr:zinc ribbon domain-containing protein [Candidatus Angelobacter sp.]